MAGDSGRRLRGLPSSYSRTSQGFLEELRAVDGFVLTLVLPVELEVCCSRSQRSSDSRIDEVYAEVERCPEGR